MSTGRARRGALQHHPLVIEALGVSPPPSIGANEFNRLFVVVKHERGATRLISGRYGA